MRGWVGGGESKEGEGGNEEGGGGWMGRMDEEE